MSQLFQTTQEAVVAYAQVALEQGIDASPAGLTYGVPASVAGLQVGERVTVPLGRKDKPASGFVLEVSGQPRTPIPEHKLKLILARDAQGLALPRDLVELARWIGSYYCCPVGMVFATMLPAAVKKGIGRVNQTMVSLADAAALAAAGKLSKLQQAVVVAAQQLRAEGDAWVEIKRLADRSGARSVAPVKLALQKGLLVSRQDSTVQSDWEEQAQEMARVTPAVQLSAAQEEAVRRLVQSVHEGFGVHLLHGVTGSGKTEVYLRAIEHALKSDAKPSPEDVPGALGVPGAIMLVPEIALTPQTVSRFLGRFSGVAVLHSGMTAAQRHEQWRRISRGGARIVVGARSAVFAPLANPRLIIVDEEHEPSYKQDQLPRYHARDVAIKRAQLLGIPVILGSATPSLESYHNAVGDAVVQCPMSKVQSPEQAPGRSDMGHGTLDTGQLRRPRFHLLRLPERVGGFKLPDVQIVDMNQERRKRYQLTGSVGVHLLSLRLEAALRQTHETGGQSMLLLNRRGYGNYIACPDHRCGWMMSCEYCDATMVYHKDQGLPAGGLVRCHHCTAEQLLPPHCPTCNRKVSVFGLGTQRVEEEMQKKLPAARLLRMDSDTMRSGRDYHHSLERFRAGEVDILVGTQMIAKGLDFPNVRLVGVISGDTALHMPDFRAAERTFQLIAQVAGRAGRSEHPGQVIVQSFSPEDPAIVLASKHDFEGFATRELALRKEVGLPPATRMARIVIRDQDAIACYEHAKTLAQHLRAYNQQLGLNVRLRGPSPCPIARVAGHHRQQIEMLAADAGRIQKLLAALRSARLLHADARTAVDVDPVAML